MPLKGVMQIDVVSDRDQTFSCSLNTLQGGHLFFSCQDSRFAISCLQAFHLISIDCKHACKLKIRTGNSMPWRIIASGTGSVNGHPFHNSWITLSADQLELETSSQMLAISPANPVAVMPGAKGSCEAAPQLLREIMALLGHMPANTADVLRLVTLLTGEPLENAPGPDLHPADAEKLRQARLHMEQHLQSPPSLFELARLIGLNDYKLKRDFKKLFGTTVFGYLYEKRMEKARNLLEAGRLPVGEIAYLVGYKNPQHFTAAFKKKFGCLPRAFRQPAHHESGL